MKTKLLLVSLALISLSLALSACTNGQLQASGWPGITADEETVYMAFNQHVYAINLNTGVEKWRYPAEAEKDVSFYAPPAFTEDGQVIVGGYNNLVYSLNTQTGQTNWVFSDAQDRIIGSALVADGMIYVPSSDNNLYAIDLQGQSAWAQAFSAENSNWGEPATDPNCECIYLASMDHSVHAIDPATGQPIWRSEILGGATVGTPAVSEDGQLYIGTFLNELIALNTQNGQILWRFPTGDWVWASPVISGDTVYFGDIAGNFYALNRLTGTQLWTVQADGSIVGEPLLANDGLYFTTEAGSLYALTLEGGTRWTKNFNDALHTGPVAAGDTILVATDKAGLILYALDTEGLPKWQFSPASEK